MILDTNAISALLDGNQQMSQILRKDSKHHLPLGVIGEYLFGLQSSEYGKRLESLFRRLEADSEILYPDRQTANSYATIRHDLKKRGRPIPEGDLWIAALARQHKLKIVSHDTHFDLVTDVQRIAW